MTSPLLVVKGPDMSALSVPMEKTAWAHQVLESLKATGSEGVAAVSFIESRRIIIGFSKQKVTGAKWSLDGNIYLNSNSFSLSTPPNHPFMLNLIAHEALHLKQGIATALSVYGELEAWQLGFHVFQSLGGMIYHSSLKELMGLELSYDRDTLKKVRYLMQDYAGKGYRIDLLPCYPVWKEIRYFFTRRIPSS